MWEPKDVRVARDVAYGGNSGEVLPNGVGQGYFTMAAAFVAVGVGSAGAAVLAMSLLSSDPPAQMPEREIIESAMAAETSEPPVKAEEPIFKDLIPSATQPAQASAVALAVPPTRTTPALMPTGPAALQAGDPRFAHDASAARGISDISELADDDLGSAFVPATRPSTTPFDGMAQKSPPQVARDEVDDDPVETAAATPPPKPKAEPEAAVGTGKAASGTALMIDDANIRSRPQKGSKVIGTVPARTVVQLVSCQSWCEIIVKGKRGYVWGDFVQRGQSRTKTKFTVSKAESDQSDVNKPEIVPAKAAAPHPDQNSR